MWRTRILVLILMTLTLWGWANADTPPSVKDLTFLTRDGCEHTPDMLNNLDDALRALKLPLTYPVVNIGTLRKTDPRRGYPTPTVLYKGADIFGMPTPMPPFPEPT
jgi:hypothetical protein